MSRAAPSTGSASAPAKGASSTLTWRPTKIMNMRDLSRDDDFLSHLLVEKLGTGAVPLLVHKMDPSRRLPKTDAIDLLAIVRRLVSSKASVQHATRQAVDELTALPPVRYYLKSYTQKQINAFATHASRYFELYHPSGSIEIAHTSRYSHRTGKSELCILATRPLTPGTVVSELKGSMAHLTKEEDKELKRTDLRNTDIRRDFSVIHSRQMKKNHLFLGPARFVNHDCENNCELFREGKYITFRVIRPIAVGEEITAHYGDGYFGRKNRHCLCETCEKKGRGGYTRENDDDTHSGSLSDSDSDVRSEASLHDPHAPAAASASAALNVNERRTRRGVYAIVQEEDDESDESDDEEGARKPLADAKDVPKDGEIELEADMEAPSELSSLPPSRASMVPLCPPSALGLPTPEDSVPSPMSDRDSSMQPRSAQSTPFRSIISTRGQKARQQSAAVDSARPSPLNALARHPFTPPLSDAASAPDSSRASVKRALRSSAGSTPAKDVVKKEKSRDEVDSRVLRVRPSAPAASAEQTVHAPVKKDVPRGPDGKPLPTCITCQNVLPVISVDSKVVWGLTFESNSPPRRGRKRKLKQECPRCLRHSAIYAHPWPSRVAGQNSAPTPPVHREDSTPADSLSRRITHKSLPALDRKICAAVSAQRQRIRDSAHEPPPKRQKTAHVPLAANGVRSRLAMVGVGRGARSGRHSTPSPKVQQQQQQQQQVEKQDGEQPQPVKRKRGRPRLSSPRPPPATVDKIMRPKSLAVQSQPRDSNGRFGRKNDAKKTASAEDGSQHVVVKPSVESVNPTATVEHEADDVEGVATDFAEDRFVSPVNKRKFDQFEDISVKRSPSVDEHALKRLRLDADSKSRSLSPFTNAVGPYKKKHSLSLFPSPTHFAMRHALDAERSADADDHQKRMAGSQLRTPPDSSEEAGDEAVSQYPRTDSAYGLSRDERRDEESVAASNRLTFLAPRIGAQIMYKPSPLLFASRRRWLSGGPAAVSASMRSSSDLSGNSSLEQYKTKPAGPIVIPTKKGTPYGRRPLTRPDLESLSSGEEDVILPESPDPSMFILQRRASFGTGAGGAIVPTDSEQGIARLLAIQDDVSSQSSEGAPPVLSRKSAIINPEHLRKSEPFSADTETSPPSLVDGKWVSWNSWILESDSESEGL